MESDPELVELRDRAFTFRVNGYAELRRAVGFLRPGEVARPVPPPYPSKGGSAPSRPDAGFLDHRKSGSVVALC